MRRQLAQLRPGGTSATLLFSPDTSNPYTIDLINICNTSAGPANISIYHDSDGTTYDETTALFFSKTINANETFQIEVEISHDLQAGGIAVQTSVANAITFTAYGEVSGEVR